MDQAYYEFVHHGPAHVFPNLAELGYPNQLIHLCSFSKAFSLAGWRLGYMAYPGTLHAAFRKVGIPPPPLVEPLENLLDEVDNVPTPLCFKLRLMHFLSIVFLSPNSLCFGTKRIDTKRFNLIEFQALFLSSTILTVDGNL